MKQKTVHTDFTRWQCKYYYIYIANKRLIWQTIYITLQTQQQRTSWQHAVMPLQNNKSYSAEWWILSWSWLGNLWCPSQRWWWYIKRTRILAFSTICAILLGTYKIWSMWTTQSASVTQQETYCSVTIL